MRLNLKLNILVELGHFEDALLLVRNYLSVRSRRYKDSKVILLREVISNMVEEIKEKCSDNNPAIISELAYILKELDHAGTIKEQTLEEAILTPVDATNRDETRKQIQRNKWGVEEQVQYKARIKSSGLETAVYGQDSVDHDIDGFQRWFGARPSLIEEEQGIKAVKVIRPGLTQEDVKSVSEEDLERITKEFQDKRTEGDRSITKDFIKELAMKYHFTAGKWMIFTQARHGDKLWEDMATALLEGRFPEAVTSVRANLHDRRGQERLEFKVNVETRDFSKEDEVRSVEDVIVSNLNVPLRNISLTYKPEIYSHLNIYNGNHFGSSGRGIRPSMYTSKVVNNMRSQQSH